MLDDYFFKVFFSLLYVYKLSSDDDNCDMLRCTNIIADVVAGSLE